VGHQRIFRLCTQAVNCSRSGIRVEQMPWVTGKHRLTEAYVWFLAGWAKRLSWSEVVQAFHTTWDPVFYSVERAVTWGREHQDLSGITAIGVDNIA
jgi:transposase